MTRFMINGAAAVLVLAMLALTAPEAMAQGGARGQRNATQPERRMDPRAETMQKLTTQTVNVELEDARLEDVVEFVKQVSDAKIEALWQDDRYDQGLSKDREITVGGRDMTVLAFIERVLDRAAEDRLDPATWMFDRDGYLLIGPKSRLNRFAVTKIYDVRSLIMTLPDHEDAPQIDIDQVLQQGQQGGGGGGQSIFEDEQQDDEGFAETDLEEELQELMDIIRDIVETRQWEVNGGDGGHMRAWKQNLIIVAPDYIHRQVGGYDWWRDPWVAKEIRRESGISQDSDASGSGGGSAKADGSSKGGSGSPTRSADEKGGDASGSEKDDESGGEKTDEKSDG